MKANRVARVESFLQEEFGSLFQKIGKNTFPGVLISVTAVKITPDLSIARIYLSVFPYEKHKDVKLYLDENYVAIKQEAAKLVGKHLRIMPDLHFLIDEAFEKEAEIDKLLKEGGENPIK
ncbi:ribosome-binding factor A [Thermaurantimonas aggregans]|uniref:Ribosome-binding factor A n=1 Tax=Thermaurantimonas aggregans TaxID=2173829 RepID=A0A401XIK5_9FLAO|nr:ribosome-binding factor A [Thermaurantimonas aggregans]MCX8148795.1 ribosome-binding factor A [Thermaurantimonas aggregans]GCD76852.1 ribosome-binding factor A [Thermaurantimonas aggregans]